MSINSTNWTNGSINSTNYTNGTINSTNYLRTFTYLLLSEDVVTLASNAYDLRGLPIGTNSTYLTNWTQT